MKKARNPGPNPGGGIMKMLESVIKSTTFVCIPKNILQLLMGFACFYSIYRQFDPIVLLLGIIAFTVSYSAVYPFNDLQDLEEDKKDPYKRHLKPMVRGEMGIETAASLSLIFAVFGLLVSVLFLNRIFTAMLALTLLLNIFYSSNITRFKKRFPHPSMFLVQIVKFSAGWFLFTTDITNFPIWAIICFSAVHTLVYVIHKSGIDISKAVRNIWFIIFVALINISLFLSIALYPFRMPLVLSFALLTVPIIILQSNMRVERKLFLDYSLMQVIMAIFVTTAIIGL